ncbi:unnamed protein product [Discula destructiva]
MQVSTLAHLAALVGAVSAAPAPAPLNYDDVLLVGDDGSSKVIKEADYHLLKSRGVLTPAPAAVHAGSIKTRSSSNDNEKRCDESSEVQVVTDEKFLNWDVPMSSVVSAAGGGVMVAVTSGYSISNALQTTVGMEATIEEVLGLSMQVSYTETWTTTETTAITYTVPANNYGLIVSQPMVRRIEGYYLSGCVDSPAKEAFTSDTYSSQSYGNLEWVTGVIRLCNSTSYPVPYCIGTGEHS